ncbi:hypothetical protein ABH931_002666 [Streptacidiphilus sp. MAP12-33]
MNNPVDTSTPVLAHWVFSGIGLSPELARLAQALSPPGGTGAQAARG